MYAGRILVVDDNRLNRLTLAQYLRQQGHTVALAENGQAALELLQKEPFDLLLLDIVMPEKDGYQVLEEVRASPALRSLPVIVISAVEEMDSVVRCIQMGAEDYLPKPFDPVLLRARIGACLETKRLHDQEVAYLEQIRREKKRADDLLNVVIPLGVALAGERDLHALLDRAVSEAMTFCNAGSGRLYLRGQSGRLEAMIVRPDGAAAVEEDSDPGLLSIPLKDSSGQAIGLLQLGDRRQPETGLPAGFDDHLHQMVESFSRLAAVALEAYWREQRLRQEISQLRIDLDRARVERQVEEITESEYFQRLRSDVSELRKMLEQS